MAKRKRQLRLLGKNPPETLALFPGGEYESCAPKHLGGGLNITPSLLTRHSSPFLAFLEELVGVKSSPLQLSPHHGPHLIQPVTEGSLWQS